MKLKSQGSAARRVTRLAQWAPLLVALASTHCGSDDNANESASGAGGTVGTGVNTGTATATATTTPTSSSTSDINSTTSSVGTTLTTTTGMGTTTGFGAATTTGTSGTTTGFGGPGFGGTGAGGAGGAGGTSATPTTTTGGTGGTDVAPGETGVFEGTVAAHNQTRAEVDVTPPLPEMVWSDEMAVIAQDWADTLTNEENCGTIFHRSNPMYGENIALVGSFGASDPFTGPDAVAMWVAEIECYTYGTIGQSEQCEPSCIAAQNSSGCGHYTQVVWEETTSVGCGYGSCEDGNTTIEVIVCNYDPPGNYFGETPY